MTNSDIIFIWVFLGMFGCFIANAKLPTQLTPFEFIILSACGPIFLLILLFDIYLNWNIFLLSNKKKDDND
jgi:hypothetical protein